MTVYLDNAATTPMLPEAAAAMTAQFARVGNPSSLHASGRDARRLVEESRERIAAALGCRPGEVVFTSGGTEADNLAVKGIALASRTADPRRDRVLASAVEHHAVLDSLHWLRESREIDHELIPVDSRGTLRVDALREVLDRSAERVGLISVMWANNEVGTLQPIDEVVAIAREHGIPVHSDAVQAAGHVAVDFAASGLDAMTVTGHKLGGPYGVGALVVRRDLVAEPLLHGGGQERDIRSGTLDTPAIVGFAVACEAAVRDQEAEGARLRGLRDELVRRMHAAVPGVIYNGDPDQRLPGNAHFSFPGAEGDALLMLLDARGVECSTGSACNAGIPQASHVLLAMGASDADARSSLRFTFGHDSVEADVDAVIEAIVPAVERARAAGSRS